MPGETRGGNGEINPGLTSLSAREAAGGEGSPRRKGGCQNNDRRNKNREGRRSGGAPMPAWGAPRGFQEGTPEVNASVRFPLSLPPSLPPSLWERMLPAKKGEIPIDGTGTGCRNPCGAAPQRGRCRGRAERCGLRGSVRPARFLPVRVQPRARALKPRQRRRRG